MSQKKTGAVAQTLLLVQSLYNPIVTKNLSLSATFSVFFTFPIWFQ